MSQNTRYHVYAEDGFESAHQSLNAAVHAAKQGHSRRGVHYKVVETDAYELTGAGHGRVRFSTQEAKP